MQEKVNYTIYFMCLSIFPVGLAARRKRLKQITEIMVYFSALLHKDAKGY